MKNFMALLVSFFCFCHANGQGVVLDSSFGSYGKITSGVQSYSSDEAQSIVCQADGKIIAGGTSSIVSSDTRGAMIRYHSNGKVDSSFGNNGRVILFPGSGSTQGKTVAIQKLPSGFERIIFGAYYSGSGSMVMGGYLPNGALDASFGSGGIVQLPGVFPMKILSDPTGRLLVAGSNVISMFGMFRFLPNGTLDNSFGSNGFASIPDTGRGASTAMAIQPDGKIIAGGRLTFPPVYPKSDIGLARYLATGKPDSSFGVNGLVTIDPDTNEAELRSIAVQADGKILACGISDTGTGIRFYLTRFLPNGSVDNNFGSNGVVRTDFGNNQSWANEVLVQNDGKIYVVGYAAPASAHSYAFAIARFTTNGSLDTTFGVNGKDTSNIGAWSGALAAAITPGLKVVAAGWSHFSLPADVWDDFALMQYLTGLELGIVDLQTFAMPVVYPNPVRNGAKLSFQLASDEVVTVRLVDMTGRTVFTFYSNEFKPAGKHEDNLVFDNSIAAGNYLLQLTGAQGSYTIKIQVHQ